MVVHVASNVSMLIARTSPGILHVHAYIPALSLSFLRMPASIFRNSLPLSTFMYMSRRQYAS